MLILGWGSRVGWTRVIGTNYREGEDGEGYDAGLSK